ncbi:phosphoribosylformylglycinamidine cyclo-ligase [Actinocatenispora rupis]|uniref:Phosphoribosylformylglycinamidine cyclo-ligase n=1 Tax=Actinocatenispora rupis TaxID=519421 RepID=A0A8J3NEF2_9ACTN|nr:phosphoribosylformylglycinamidine cyclo-ligase [Actinocatenispora rupis]
MTQVTDHASTEPGGTPATATSPGSTPARAGTVPWSGAAGRPRKRGASYAEAGVNIEAGEQAVELMKSKVHKTFRPEVVGGIGGFAGLFALDTEKYKKPLLASSTDGVGTKLVIAQQMGIHDTVGVDLVAMVVDDLVVCGAEPLFLQDYVACGEVVPERIVEIVAGIADGCRYAGCSLVGGEVAEHPGMLRPDEYDISGTGIGVVEADQVLGAERVQLGDTLIALGSSGLHSNGYSLVRHVLLGAGRMKLDTVVEDLGSQRTLGEELLVPTKIYAQDCMELIQECDVHAFAHITGGGIPGNLVRSLPEDLDAIVDRSSWRPQPIFDLVATKGRIDSDEMERTFNQGVGMVAIVGPADVDRAISLLAAREVDAWVLGEIVEGNGHVQMLGSHTRG